MSESTSALDGAQLHTELDTIFNEVIDQLSDLVAIPSVAWPSFDPANVRASADAVAGLARSLGLDVDILSAAQQDGTEGFPAVVASVPAPVGAQTVLLYAHHDVQPPGKPEAWDTEPFVATRVGDRLYGRGAADDKAGIMVHLTALRLLADRLGVGVTLFIEGEEEAGSPSFRNFLETYQDRLAADVIVVADSGNWAAGTPALTTSLRGMCAIEFEVSTLDHAVHSGMYGGVVPDAMLAMTQVLASVHDENGSVAVSGLKSQTVSEIDYEEPTIRADSGVLDSTSLIGSGSLASRLWTQPSITVIGLDIPDVDVSSNTLQSSLKAKLSIRLAPGDTPDNAVKAVEQHLRDNLPFGATLTIGDTEGGSPWQADLNDPVVQTARRALTEAWGQESVTMGIGGSIPFIADLLEVFPQASILVTGVEDPDARAHSANESLYLPDFKAAIVAEALLLQSLAAT
ncbi:MAG: dipeptidase [Brevibacterium sp.]|uniref:dipeptidase n=1 Tax=Brevibacterium sp. TaxID=1701 RepID=UPI002647F56C|nr:dipeptidase [Brevibacterium sp.]MDN5807297.1 dipeptidase [Brevibacterium sp.]MDN5833662.1 dipeptidase [Brevibacterium sp.]MDN5876385.1 dipeptidase [Brevibacterium sp.]MDN5909857.1 dipeptidase [Brevibacterium sp.]MDN6134708.1 dipeptidase [Brevibacterium sp.]